MTSLSVLYVVYFFSIGIFIVAGLLTLAMVIPLQVAESRVKNGLHKLRQQLLAKGVLSEIAVIVSVFALTSRFFITVPDTNRYVITILVLTLALCTLGNSHIDSRIYRQQYTLENKKLHEKIEKLEKSKKSV